MNLTSTLSDTKKIAEKTKLTKLEAIRGFAAVYVVFHHAFSKGFFIFGKDVSILFRFGQEAVILFFLLSGFVIQYAYIHSKDKTFKTFFLKRFLRIYIPLICVFIANYVILSFENKHFTAIDWQTLTGNIFMLQDIASLKPNVLCSPFLNNSPLWSLSYEWWFYMLFFLIVNKVNQNTSLVVYCIGIIAACSYVLYPNFFNRELMYLIIWWTGADMAKQYINNMSLKINSLKLPIIALTITMVILIINVKIHNSTATIGVSPFLELRHFAFALFTVFLALGWSKSKWIGFKQLLGPFEYIAPISFGVYISHWFLFANAHYLDYVVTNTYLRLLAYALVCVLFSYLVERVIFTSLNKLVIKRFTNKNTI